MEPILNPDTSLVHMTSSQARSSIPCRLIPFLIQPSSHLRTSYERPTSSLDLSSCFHPPWFPHPHPTTKSFARQKPPCLLVTLRPSDAPGPPTTSRPRRKTTLPAHSSLEDSCTTSLRRLPLRQQLHVVTLSNLNHTSQGPIARCFWLSCPSAPEAAPPSVRLTRLRPPRLLPPLYPRVLMSQSSKSRTVISARSALGSKKSSIKSFGQQRMD